MVLGWWSGWGVYAGLGRGFSVGCEMCGVGCGDVGCGMCGEWGGEIYSTIFLSFVNERERNKSLRSGWMDGWMD